MLGYSIESNRKPTSSSGVGPTVLEEVAVESPTEDSMFSLDGRVHLSITDFLK